MVNAVGLDDFLVGENDFVIDDLKLPDYENIPFDFSALGEAMDLAILYEEARGNRQIRDYCSQMVTRFKSLEERREYAFLRHAVAPAGRAGDSIWIFWRAFSALHRTARGSQRPSRSSSST
jgi:hypothetical protein